MRVLNLFDGIGGFALAAEWMGWQNVGSCEIDPFCRRVLDYHFDYEYVYTDIKSADFTALRGRIDLITGGFPCQPFSCAGSRKGTDDNRYLWPQMLRAIREVSPRWVVAENVRGLLSIEKGMVFEQVCLDLEDAGYEVQPFVIPAVAVNAPHRRDRVWFVAHAKCGGYRGWSGESCRERELGDCVATDSASLRLQRRHIANERRLPKTHRLETPHCAVGWEKFPTEPPIYIRDDGFSKRLLGITVSKWRAQAVKACGNAIVPQVALQIFKTIQEMEEQTNE